MGNRHPEGRFNLLPARSLRARLREAFYCSQFVVRYQPQVELAGGAVCGMEARVHWQDPQTGEIPADALIPLLEDTGLILEVERWAIRHVLSQRLAWYIGGLRAPTITVPVSELHVRQPDFARTLGESLQAVGVGPHGLALAVHEGLVLGEAADVVEKLAILGRRGVRVTVCGFGTRCASLDYLERLAVHELRIDRSFIDRMADGARDIAVVSTMISLAHSANHPILAEGVNSRQQASLLRHLECDRIQGDYASAPLAAEDVPALLGAAPARAVAA